MNDSTMVNPLQNWPIVITQDLIWGDMDAYQHINNTVFFRYFEDARMAYFEQIGVNHLMQAQRLGPILASTKADFKAPLVYPDTLQIGAKITFCEGKKMNMVYQVYSKKLAKIVAEGEGLIVYFDYQSQKSCDVPASIQAAIQQLEG